MFEQYLDADGYQDYAAYNADFTLKELPEFVAETKTAKDKRNVTTPITITGVVMDILSKEKLSPAASASMLVAMERISRIEAVSLVSFSSFDAVLAA
jgi:hypothetical protein